MSIVTLLRAVGHVLHKVDARADPDVRAEVDRKWDSLKKTKPKPEILWEFIESERNSVVKQYEFGFARRFVASKPPPGEAGLMMKVDLLSVSGGQLPAQELPGLESQIEEGPFEGLGEKDVAEKAIKWWDECLAEIEDRVARRKASGSWPNQGIHSTAQKAGGG